MVTFSWRAIQRPLPVQGVRINVENIARNNVVNNTTLIGTQSQQRRSQRSNRRNSCLKRGWKTCIGYLELLIPKFRNGSCFPRFLTRRRLNEETLLGVIREAWVPGVSTGSMKRLAGALGTMNLSRSKGSRICRNSINGFKSFANARSRATGCFSGSTPPI